MPIQVTICGGGNTSHFSAAVISANPNYIVNVFTRRPELWSKQLVAVTKGSSWEGKGEIKGILKRKEGRRLEKREKNLSITLFNKVKR